MAAFLRQPAALAWSAGALTNTEVDGSNHVILTSSGGGAVKINEIISDDTGAGDMIVGYTANDWYYSAQSFTAAAGGVLAQIDTQMYKAGTIAAGKLVWLELYSDDGVAMYNAKPNASLSVATAMLANSVTAGRAMYSFTFPGDFTIVLGTRYWIVWKCDFVASTTNFLWTGSRVYGVAQGETWARYPTGGVPVWSPRSTGKEIQAYAVWTQSAATYDTPGDWTSPVIDAKAGKRLFMAGWDRAAYIDDEAITSVQVRGSDTAPTSVATNVAYDDDAIPHVYWSSPTWSPGAWETLTQDVMPALTSRYVQFKVNMAASHDAAETPTLNALWELFHGDPTGVSASTTPGKYTKKYHLEVAGYDLGGHTSTLNFPVITRRRGGERGLNLDTVQFDLDNITGFFNPVGGLGGGITGRKVKAWVEYTGVMAGAFTLFDGVGESIALDEQNYKAIIKATEYKLKFSGYQVATTGNDVTPASALKTNLDLAGWVAGVDYDEAAIYRAAIVQTSLGIIIDYDFTAEDKSVALPEFIRLMCLYGCGNAWVVNGKLYYRVWDYFYGGSGPELTTFERAPAVDAITSVFYNDYAITPVGGTTVKDATAGNIGADSRTMVGVRTLTIALASEIACSNALSAQRLGERWITRCAPTYQNGRWVARRKATITIDLRYLDRIVLGGFIGVTWSRAELAATIFEVDAMEVDATRESLTLELEEAQLAPTV